MVAPGGDDARAGTPSAPFASLERARDAVRQALASGPPKEIVVWLRAGIYERDRTLLLDERDSGQEGAPVTWRAWPGEAVHLVGGRRLDPEWFSPVTPDSPVWSRLDPSARGQVLEVDLPAHGISDFGKLAVRPSGDAHAALELFVDGAPMRLGRWPDAGQDDPPTATAQRLVLVGLASPDVTGSYVATGTQDGVSSFEREGLVDGKVWHLYRSTRTEPDGVHSTWILGTGSPGLPGSTDPRWFCSADFSPDVCRLHPSNGAAGELTPARIHAGFATASRPVADAAFGYLGDRPARWATAPDPWFHGFWFYSWADQHLPGASVDGASGTIRLAQAPRDGLLPGAPFYAYNLLEEITEPGEWYLDRSSGILYLWPPHDLRRALVVVSLLDGPLVQMAGTSFVSLQDLTLEATRAELVSVAGGTGGVLDGLTLRDAGTTAAVLSGTGHLVRSAHVYGTGGGGVVLSGGDRRTLAPGGNAITNSHVHDCARFTLTYQPAVRLSGVGNAVRNNLIHDTAQSAILFEGDEHVIELNDIARVCAASSDAGAIYGGRDWSSRGVVIRNNFIHHLRTSMDGDGVSGIYLDDCLSGVQVVGNVLYAIAGRALLHGGGRDVTIASNVVARSSEAFHADSRCADGPTLRAASTVAGDSWNLLEKLEKVGYRDEPRRSRYPECAAIPDSWEAILAPGATWTFPEGSRLVQNVGFANAQFLDSTPDTLGHFASVGDNLEDRDPHFVDEARQDLTLRDDSPALTLPGFVPIPFERIGLRAPTTSGPGDAEPRSKAPGRAGDTP